MTSATSVTTTYLPEKSVSWLQDLIQVNLDSRDGFKNASEHLKENHRSLDAMFRRIAVERDGQGKQLQALVDESAETPKKSGSTSAAVHRAWMDLRSAFGGGEHALLSAAERGEDYIKAKYEEAIKDLKGCTCVTVLSRQHSAVVASHDAVRDLRDRQKKT